MPPTLPGTTPGRPDDTGEPDPILAGALAADDTAAALSRLLLARLLLPVVASGGGADGEVDAVMSVPARVDADGRRALPVFTGLESLQRWRPDARPVPMPGSRVVVAADEAGYAALVLDVAGPVDHVVSGADLGLLAAAARQLEAGRAAAVQVIDES